MTKLFTFARTTAVAALALGAGALLIPEPAEAQGRSGFSGGGGRSMGFSGGGGRSMGFSGGGRSMGFAGGGRSMGFAGAGPRGAGFAGPRMAAPRMVYGAGARTYGQRAIASGAYGGRNFAYPTRGYRTAGVTAQHWRHRPGHRPPYYYRGGWYGGYPYWGVGAGLGLGLASAAYFANDGYYADDCWLERRWVRTAYGRTLANVRVCYGY